MFRCGNCNKNVQTGQPTNKVVVEKRNKTYEVLKKVNKYKREMREVNGWEISKEIYVCPECFSNMTGLQPRLVVPLKPTEREQKHRCNNKNNRRRFEHPNSKKTLIVQKLNNVKKSKQ